MDKHPTFDSPAFLLKHIDDIFNFYHPKCIDPNGGFYHVYHTHGYVLDKSARHLVNSTRFVINYARMARIKDCGALLQQCQHGIDFIEQQHKGDNRYFWQLNDGKASVQNDYCYGWVFVLLAYAECIKSGMTHLRPALDATYQGLNNKFWDEGQQLYADEYDEHGQLSPYRGQNANMHAVEALLICYEATQESHFLNRASAIAKRICHDLADPKTGLVWEHYNSNWEIDWHYNEDKPNDMFRPWGFQTGHQTEWAKLLINLNHHQPQAWLIAKAEQLFNDGMQRGWDETHGGLVYGFAPNGEYCDTDKHFWVMAESTAAAMALYKATDNDRYLQQYQRLWLYSWSTLVDHQYGAWHHKTHRDGMLISDVKSPLGKCDYHTLGACYEMLTLLSA